MSPTIATRKIGNENVSAISYGAMGLGTPIYGEVGSDEDRFKVLDRLFELGCTSWDTAAPYGDSEELIGKWFARTGNRDKIFLATKFGSYYTPQFTLGVRGDREFVRETVATSLERFQTDRIDLLYQHRTDPKVPIEITVRAMAELVKEGKVRHLGLSEASPDTIRRAHKVHPIAALQVEYSAFELDLEKPGGVIEVCRELGITIVAYSPTGRGLVTGRYRSIDDLPEGDFRRTAPKYAAKNWPHINKLVDSLREIGLKYKATSAQIALAWLLAQGDDIIPIPGSKQIKYIEENLGALNVKLEDADVKAIRKLCDELNLAFGNDLRYHESMMDAIYVDTPPLKE